MKTSLMVLLLTFLAFSIKAGDGNMDGHMMKHGKLMVEIEGLTSTDGSLKVLLFNAGTGYPLDEWNALYAIDLDITDARSTMVFESIPFQEYALFVYHDENENGKLDKNWTGAVKESYGYSKEVSGIRNMPLYENSVFQFNTDGQIITIQMIELSKKATRLEVHN